ncbi:U4/U6-U5 snRNP complex subunit SNU23 Ecym_5617 [Eremothecium cymbalariae DBVPG|uniref:C2H2-type domain-containing protein n=1 Tax=Eremothecium cymbalariae (strain CBS 270.75 / DBVPG 7215 / KCTC 17166 / NRRL Y-17582) TaxID=931890 RepID=I6NE61_ERECY|nr:hypothetical protein Ecym_5617 [Eremothecium cymbalariae DBVPG\
MSTYGRRTWDRDEYKQLAKERNVTSHLGELNSEQLQKLKLKYTDFHKLILDSIKDTKKRVITSGLTSYKKGKQFGFYCDLCDMTFKDTLQYIDHLSHKIHQIKFEQIFNEPLILDQRDNEQLPLDEFSREYKSFVTKFINENTSFKTANKKPRKRIKINEENTTANFNDGDGDGDGDDISNIMGFGSFGTTKKAA